MGRFVFTALLAGTACGLDFDAPIVTSDATLEVHSLLLTEAPLRAAGGAAVSFALPADISAPVVTQAALSPQALVATGIMRGTSENEMESVCKRTSAALLSEAPDATATDRILGGPVYRECTAALAPIRTGEQASAVNLLNDCMTLVDKIVEKLGKPSGAGTVDNDALCHDVVTAMEPTPAPTTTVAPVEELLVPMAHPQQEQAAVTVTETEELRAIVAAMPQVCTETVSAVESGIKTEADALKLGTTVAPVCESTARKHLGAAVDVDIASAALQSWCHQLDTHLTDALQTGFLYALHPIEAQKKFGGPNPYATTTRRQFCQGFNEAVQKAKVSVTVKHASIPAVVAVPAPEVVPTPAAVASNDAPKAPWEVLSDSNVAPKASMAAGSVEHVSVSTSPVPVVQAVVTTVAPQISATQPVSADDVDGAGMLHLVQEVSAHAEWRAACEQLTSKLTSHEGSIMEESAFGTKETPVGTQVLTFNAHDHSEIRNCAANMKVIAIEVGMLKKGAVQEDIAKPSDSVKEAITKGAASMLESADQSQALIDSPWAADACSDMAHSYLATRIAHPDTKTTDFCPWYAKDLQSMLGGSVEASPQTQVADDVTLLRRRHAQKSKLRAAEALSAHSKAEKALPQVSPRPATALIRGSARAAPSKVVESERKVALAAKHVVVPAYPSLPVAAKVDVKKPAPSEAEEATPEQEDAEGANLWQGMF